jgi:Green fluorescent protein
MDDVNLTIKCSGMINGEIVTAAGTGQGSVDQGSLAINLTFSSIPAGFSIYCASQWTACCSTPTFAIEQNGGVNMLTLTKGRYRCDRTFDFGEYGTYLYNYEIRLNAETGEMSATGALQGTLDLPELVSVEPNFTEIMVLAGPDLVRSFSRSAFIAADGKRIPVRVEGKYRPLAGDAASDWTCCASDQVRRSFINVLHAEGTGLSLIYSTVIAGIHAPDALPEFGLSR